MVTMTPGGDASGDRRRRFVVPDLDGEIVAATGPLEDTLLALAAPVDEPDDPLAQVDLVPGDAETLEIVSAGAHALGLVRAVMDRSPAVELIASDGSVHEPLRVVEVPADQLDAVGAAVEVLTAALGPGGAAIIADGLEAAADHLGTTSSALVELARRTHQLCDLPWDADQELVVAAVRRAAPPGPAVVLSEPEEAAMRRLHARLLAIWDRPTV